MKFHTNGRAIDLTPEEAHEIYHQITEWMVREHVKETSGNCDQYLKENPPIHNYNLDYDV